MVRVAVLVRKRQRHAVGRASHVKRGQHLRHGEEVRRPVTRALLVVASDHGLHSRIGRGHVALADAHDASAEERPRRVARGAHVEGVAEVREHDGEGMEPDLRIPRRVDVRVTIADRGHDLGHPDDHLGAIHERDPGVEIGHQRREPVARDGVVEVLVRALHLLRHETQVLAPGTRLGGGHGKGGRRRGEHGDREQRDREGEDD